MTKARMRVDTFSCIAKDTLFDVVKVKKKDIFVTL